MRVLFATWAWPSHYYPMVPLAWALRAAGHEVRVASQPALAPAIERSGLHPVCVGTDVDYAALTRRQLGTLPTLSSSRGWWDEMRRSGAAAGSFEVFVVLAEAMTADLIDFARAYQPHLVVHDTTTYAAPLAAAAVGAPAVRHTWGPDLMYRYRAAAESALAPLGDRHGVPAADFGGSVTVDPCPAAMQVATSDLRLRIRYVPYNGPGRLPRWLLDRPARPRICVTCGTSSARLAGDRLFLVPEVARALQGAGYEIVAAVSADDRPLLGALPQGVRVVESLPLHLLLPTCELLIHQGGGGTTMTGLTCGLPQLVIPQLPDHAFNARQFARTGAGIVLYPAELTRAGIRDSVGSLRGESAYRAAARQLTREMLATPSPVSVVPVLEELAAPRPSRGAAPPEAGAMAPAAGAMAPALGVTLRSPFGDGAEEAAP